MRAECVCGFNDVADQSTARSHFINNIIIYLFSSNCSTIWGKEDVEHWSWNTNIKSFQITVCQWKHLHISTSIHNGRHFWECDAHLHFYFTRATNNVSVCSSQLVFTFDVKQKAPSFQSLWAMYVCTVRSVRGHLDPCEYRVKKRENARAYMCTEEQGISCVRSIERRNALSLPREIHRPFLLVSPSTKGDFPNCKSRPFIVPTNSGWQHSLHCHTPHYNRQTLLQLLSVCVCVSVSSKCFHCPQPHLNCFQGKQTKHCKTKSFREKIVIFFLKFQQQQYSAKTKVNISSKLNCTRKLGLLNQGSLS